MNETLPVLNQKQGRQRDLLVDRLLQSTAGVFDIFTIYIGERSGFHRALAGAKSLTPGELASRTNTHERYVREWLEQQTVAGITEVEDASVGALDLRFRLPAGHAEVLVERESLNYLVQLAVGVTRPLESLLDAYRNGGGVPLTEYGTDFVEVRRASTAVLSCTSLGPNGSHPSPTFMHVCRLSRRPGLPTSAAA